MSTPFLPSTLPLLPLPPPQLLFPYLRVTVPLTAAQVSVVLKSVTENAKAQKLDDGSSRVIAVVPVIEHERRVGRWACGESALLTLYSIVVGHIADESSCKDRQG